MANIHIGDIKLTGQCMYVCNKNNSINLWFHLLNLFIFYFLEICEETDYNTVFSVYINVTNFGTNFNIVKILHLKKLSQCLLC